MAASLLAIVCGAWFNGLPRGWHQSGAGWTYLSRGTSVSNSFSWAATPRSVFDLTRPLPRNGVYIWVSLNRPARRVRGATLRLPLRLRDAEVLEQEGAPQLPEYRFEGRYRFEYEVVVGVDLGRSKPTADLRADAEQALRALVFPTWTPGPERTRRCGP